MVINGKIDLSCRTQVAAFDTDTIILEPLPNFEIIKDLVVDMTPFWRTYEKIRPYVIRRNADPEKEIRQSEKDRKKSISLSIASCAPVVTAPARFWREIPNTRDPRHWPN